MKNDSWCNPIQARTGKRVSGGAARNVRISACGGMDAIVEDVARKTLEQADAAVRATQLKLVVNK